MAKHLCVLLLASLMVMEVSSAPGLDDYLPGLINIFSNKFQTSQTDFLGYTCNFSVKPTFRSWEFYFKGKFWCPGFAPFSGTSLTRSQSGAVKAATKDFAQKALERDLFTKEELKPWL